MEYIYAAMLIHKAGKAIDEATVKKVLEAAGVSVEEGKVKALIAALDGVDIEESIKNAAVPVVAPIASASEAPKAEAKQEKKKEEKAPEQAAAGLGALFG